MSRSKTGLDLIQIAAPCPALWDEMTGDDRARFCRECRLNVYNLSDMTREEAERFVQQREGRTCVRFFRRDDGTVLTKDCPVGVKTLRQRFARSILAIAGLVVAMLSGTVFGKVRSSAGANGLRTPLEALANWIDPRPVAFGGMMMIPTDALREQSGDPVDNDLRATADESPTE